MELDLTGHKINMLYVKAFSGIRDQKRGKIYECICDCGNHIDVPTAYLRKNKFSCGCTRKTRKDKGVRKAKIKRNGTRLYRIWKNMRRRCNNKNSEAYKNYGGRGVKVCAEWDDYLVFKEWALSHGYSDDLTIDRIDNNKGYEPINCRWVSRKIQSNNQRSNIKITYKDVTMNAAQWADYLGLTRSCIYHRIDRGWSDKEIVETPMYEKRNQPT